MAICRKGTASFKQKLKTKEKHNYFSREKTVDVSNFLGMFASKTVKFCGKFEPQWERMPIHRLLDTLYPMPRARNKKDIFVPLEN